MPNVRISRAISPQYGAWLHAAVSKSGPLQDRLFRAWGRHSPDNVHFVLLVDTGATRTCLDKNRFRELRVVQRGEIQVWTPGGVEPMDLPTFDVALELRDDEGHRHPIPALEICCADFSGRRYQGVLGRDVLDLCTLTYAGRQRNFHLDF